MYFWFFLLCGLFSAKTIDLDGFTEDFLHILDEVVYEDYKNITEEDSDAFIDETYAVPTDDPFAEEQILNLDLVENFLANINPTKEKQNTAEAVPDSRSNSPELLSSVVETLPICSSLDKVLMNLEEERVVNLKTGGFFKKQPFYTMTPMEYITWIARIFPAHASMSAISLILNSTLNCCLWYQLLDSGKNFQTTLKEGVQSGRFPIIDYLSTYVEMDYLKLLNIYCILISPLSIFENFKYLKYIPCGNMVVDGIKIACILWMLIKNNTINKDFSELIQEKLTHRPFIALMKKSLRFYIHSDNSSIRLNNAIQEMSETTRKAYDNIIQLIQNLINLSANIVLRSWYTYTIEGVNKEYFDNTPYLPMLISTIMTLSLISIFYRPCFKLLIKEQSNYLKSVQKSAQHTIEALNSLELVLSEGTQKKEWITYKEYLEQELAAKNLFNWAEIKMQTVLVCISLFHLILHSILRCTCLTDGKFAFNQLGNFIQNHWEISDLFARDQDSKAALRGLYFIFSNIGMDLYLLSAMNNILALSRNASVFFELRDMINLVENPDTDTLTHKYIQQIQFTERDRTIKNEKRSTFEIIIENFKYDTVNENANKIAKVVRKITGLKSQR